MNPNGCPAFRKTVGKGVRGAWQRKGRNYFENGHHRSRLGVPPPQKGKTFEEFYGTEKAAAHRKAISDALIGHKASDSKKMKCSVAAKTRGLGGITRGGGKGKKGWYKGLWCDSSWELAWVIYMIDHGIGFRRNKEAFSYVHEGKRRNWYPDFILDDGVYVEIKGWMTDLTRCKISHFPHALKIIDASGMRLILRYVTSTYGVAFTSLYEHKK